MLPLPYFYVIFDKTLYDEHNFFQKRNLDDNHRRFTLRRNVVRQPKRPESLFTHPARKNGQTGHWPTRLNLEEIRLDFPDSTLSSGRSYSGITPSGNIYYFDSYTCDMYEFGTDGTFVGKSIGYGRGPQESLVKHCDCFAMSDEGEIALFGSSLDFEYFSKDRKVANRFWIYKDGRLTTDTEVPKGLIVTGYSAPYYYSQVFDANGLF